MTAPLNLKTVTGIYSNADKYWVGDGFYVNNIFPTNDLDQSMSPFLLLDYAAPHIFEPSDTPHGVGEHPHKGFETVTIVYQGSVTHRDSAGNHGSIGPGDVQWMTAGSGVVHEEMHEKSFTKKGGTIEMVQLWVNLPKAYKNTKPNYQTLLNQDIPIINLPNNAGLMRIIAGKYNGITGAAKTFTPINLYDIKLKATAKLDLSLPENSNTGIFLLNGKLDINRGNTATNAELITFTSSGSHINLHAIEDCQLLVLNGEAILEPIARKGPFVMNSLAELQQAYNDYHSGKMGHLTPHQHNL